jgi:RND superfamily putative drug exporter
MKRLQNKIGLGETTLPDENKRVTVPAAKPALVGAFSGGSSGGGSTGIPNRAAPEVIPPGTPVSEAPTTRFTAAPADAKPPKEERDVTSWLGDLRNRGLRRSEPGGPPAEPTIVTPTVAHPTLPNPPADIAADETRAIPVSRPENADTTLATEQLNARGGGVSAQDLLRREGRI